LSLAFGPSAQELSGDSAFVTWDGLSGKRGGETLDHIFVHRSTPFQSVRASPHVAFSAARREDRLSDHFGIEAELQLGTGPSLAGAGETDFTSAGAPGLVPEDASFAPE
jgi:endonuclease/exonuclease/phosphatase family metal-dependent hydrolase